MLTLDLTRFTFCAPATCCQAQMLTRCLFQIYCNAQSPVRCVLKWPYLTGLLLALFCSSPDIVITRIGHHYVRGFIKPLCCLYTVSFRPQTCRDFTCQVTSITSFILVSVLSPVLTVSSPCFLACPSALPPS